MRALRLLLLLCPVAAFGQGSVSALPTGGLVPTTAAVTYYYGPGGSDANPCTVSAPCLTPGGVWNNVLTGLSIRHAVTVQAVGCSATPCNEPGFVAGTLHFDGGYLTFQGSQVPVTPTTGSATGTVTSAQTGTGTATQGSEDPDNRGSLTLTAAGWTNNDTALIGAEVCITAGPAVGQCHIIQSNTTDTLSINGRWTACDLPGGGTCTTPTSSSSFAIVRPGVKFNTSVSIPAGPNSTTAAGASHIIFEGYTGGQQSAAPIEALATGNLVTGGSVRFQDFMFVAASGLGSSSVRLMGPGAVTFARCEWDVPAYPVRVVAGNTVWLRHSYANLTGGSLISMIYVDNGGYVALTDSYATGGRGLLWVNGHAMAWTSMRNTSSAQSGEIIRWMSGVGSIQGDIYTGTTTVSCIRGGGLVGDAARGVVYIAGVQAISCPTAALLVNGPVAVFLDITAASVAASITSLLSSSGYGIAAEEGANVRIASGSSISGTPDLAALDSGYTSATSTLAALRAAGAGLTHIDSGSSGIRQ